MRTCTSIAHACWVLALAAALAACVSLKPLQMENTLDGSIARMGEPRARYTLESGQRLFFMVRPGELDSVDFDASGQFVERHRALSQARFDALAKRGGDAAAVQLEFGPPARKSLVEDSGGLLWTYSWLEYDKWRLAQVRFDKAGAFQNIEFSEDPQTGALYR